MSAAVSTKVDHFADMVTVAGTRCPSCTRAEPRIFYQVADVPVHDARLVSSYEEAVRCREVVVDGPPALAKQLPRWFMWSPMARFVREHAPASQPVTAHAGTGA